METTAMVNLRNSLFEFLVGNARPNVKHWARMLTGFDNRLTGGWAFPGDYVTATTKPCLTKHLVLVVVETTPPIFALVQVSEDQFYLYAHRHSYNELRGAAAEWFRDNPPTTSAPAQPAPAPQPIAHIVVGEPLPTPATVVDLSAIRTRVVVATAALFTTKKGK